MFSTVPSECAIVTVTQLKTVVERRFGLIIFDFFPVEENSFRILSQHHPDYQGRGKEAKREMRALARKIHYAPCFLI